MTAWLLPLLVALAASAATLAGGLVALRLADRVALLLAVAAGIVLGVAFFDLLPEALASGGGASARLVVQCTAAGFFGYLLLARALAGIEQRVPWAAQLGPASLTLHSFLDGLLMGLAFQISPQIGGMVALAVLTHDLADGVNTVSLALAASHRRAAERWLVVNGVAPLAGVLVGLVAHLPPAALTPVLGVFAGAFLYIGAVELVPRSLARDARLRTTLLILSGGALMLAVTLAMH